MEWYALTHIGAEEALANELESHGVSCERLQGGCAFQADKKKATHLLYHLQTATRLLAAVSHGPFDSLDLGKVEELIPKDETFKAECDIVHGGEGNSVDLAASLGGRIQRPVDLSKPQHVLFCQVGKTCLCGIDVAGDLSKRYYRVFTGRTSPKGTLAAALVWMLPPSAILDPFGNTGEVAIEAALRATSTSPLLFRKHERIDVLEDQRKDAFIDEQKETHAVWCFDPQLGNLRSCKKNAKLAGVEKAITFSKLDPEWMDVKFEAKAIDAIVTIPPPVTHRNPEDTHLRELCYQAAFVLKKGGELLVACLTEETLAAVERYAKTYKLTSHGTSVVYSGKLPVRVVRYGV